MTHSLLGHIVEGSLQRGLTMRLGEERGVEEIRAGRFVVIDGNERQFFAMITDVSLLSSSQSAVIDLAGSTGVAGGALMQKMLSGAVTYANVSLRTQLMRGRTLNSSFEPVKSIPSHFSPVADADASDISAIFGSEEPGNGFFHIGSPLDMDEIDLCLDLKKFAERSNGIFGKSGTGKSFLTRIVLCGLIKQDAAVNLVFDMHNEYGWMGTTEDSNRQGVRGLKQYFGNKVAVYSLDRQSTQRRGCPVENEVKISYEEITAEDILLLGNELDLNTTAAETVHLLDQKFGRQWLSGLLDLSTSEAVKDFCDTSGAHAGSVSALRRKLSRFAGECSGFLVKSQSQAGDGAKQIIGDLLKGKNIVLEFGQFRKPIQYMLVANILTREIHKEWTKRTEEALGSKGSEPRPLVITIEEAHKFLSPQLANQTIFGTIAREMRKYNVTLLVVDQRPSGIDDEVLSQIGTRITCLLNDERDIDAVLRGISGAADLRTVLATLDSKQQALLLGHAVPMPVVIKTREYDTEEFRRSMGSFKIASEMDENELNEHGKEIEATW
jgi:DNA helicase HerA-like ATPase